MFGALDEAHSVVIERSGCRVTGRQGSSLWGRLELARSELLEDSSSGELDQIHWKEPNQVPDPCYSDPSQRNSLDIGKFHGSKEGQ